LSLEEASRPGLLFSLFLWTFIVCQGSPGRRSNCYGLFKRQTVDFPGSFACQAVDSVPVRLWHANFLPCCCLTGTLASSRKLMVWTNQDKDVGLQDQARAYDLQSIKLRYLLWRETLKAWKILSVAPSYIISVSLNTLAVALKL
jgi:hypothetical protein